MQVTVPCQLVIISSDAIRDNAFRAIPPIARVPASSPAVGQALWLARHQAVIESHLTAQMWPLSTDLGGTLLCHCIHTDPCPTKLKGYSVQEGKTNPFPHSPQETKYLVFQYILLPGRGGGNLPRLHIA